MTDSGLRTKLTLSLHERKSDNGEGKDLVVVGDDVVVDVEAKHGDEVGTRGRVHRGHSCHQRRCS